MSKLTIIIPSLHSPYLGKTIEGIFKNASGDIEVITILDGYWPSYKLPEDKRLIILHRGTQMGMRKGVNSAVSIAKGEFLMKCDDHCIFGEGFDEIMTSDCWDNELCIPTRYSLDAEKWERGHIGPTEYLYMTFPYYHDNLYGMGLHGKKWLGDPDSLRPSSFYFYERSKADIKIDEIIATQGSCWVARKQDILAHGLLDEKHSFMIHQEPQELAFKFWLSGGRMIVNKKTWYAHWHKHNADYKDGWGRGLSRKKQYQTEQFGTWYWMNDKWPLATRKMEWLIEKFWPMPSWPSDWKEQKAKYEQEHPEFCGNFATFDDYGVDGLPLC